MKKSGFVFLFVLCACVVSATAGPLIIAHRGASERAPENTVAAAQLAWELGADAVEADLALSKDGNVVVMHDKTLNRTTNGSGKTTSATLDEMRTLDAGSWKAPEFTGEKIPTLAEILAPTPDGGKLVLDVKAGLEILPALKAGIDASGLKPEQFIIINSRLDFMKAARKLMPEVEVCWLTSIKTKLSNEERHALFVAQIDEIRAAGLHGIDVNGSVVTAEMVALAKQHGLVLYVYTINDVEEAKRLRDLGVDGITTDRPGVFKTELSES